MNFVRVGIVGVGHIGTAHANTILNNEVPGMVLTALCEMCKERAEGLKNEFPDVDIFTTYEEMIGSGKIDAIIIATPHYLHPTISTYALEKGVHVLSEKPIGVYTKALEETFEAWKNSGKKYAVMLNQRTDKLFVLAKRFINEGRIGEMVENTYTVTNWYRTQEYYDSESWRGTWLGEGGGVLMNQAPHNIDIWQWVCGMPKTISAVCYEGKYHKIEVEDEAIINVEYENGARGTFITSTGIENGVNRFEIIGTKGRILLEKGKLLLETNDQNEPHFEEFCDNEYNGHLNILKNFTNAILNGEELISPASNAINQLIIANASYLSSWKGEKVYLPFDNDEFFDLLEAKVANSKIHPRRNKNNTCSKQYEKKWTTIW